MQGSGTQLLLSRIISRYCSYSGCLGASHYKGSQSAVPMVHQSHERCPSSNIPSATGLLASVYSSKASCSSFAAVAWPVPSAAWALPVLAEGVGAWPKPLPSVQGHQMYSRRARSATQLLSEPYHLQHVLYVHAKTSPPMADPQPAVRVVMPAWNPWLHGQVSCTAHLPLQTRHGRHFRTDVQQSKQSYQNCQCTQPSPNRGKRRSACHAQHPWRTFPQWLLSRASPPLGSNTWSQSCEANCWAGWLLLLAWHRARMALLAYQSSRIWPACPSGLSIGVSAVLRL